MTDSDHDDDAVDEDAVMRAYLDGRNPRSGELARTNPFQGKDYNKHLFAAWSKGDREAHSEINERWDSPFGYAYPRAASSAEDDSDDDDARPRHGAGWPSRTGNPSGGGRDNA
jgi:hypothetical protein